MNAQTPIVAPRQIVHKSFGRGHGGIVRLMSPGDLGKLLKPFVFLDLFSAPAEFAGSMPLHPHSGIATITVITEGNFRFDDPQSGQGYLGYGGVEWMRAGGGVWHGKELSAGTSSHVKGFQLWIALPAALENGPVDSQYIEAADMPTVGPARLIVGAYDGVHSPVRAPDGVNYLLVTLKAGQRWSYVPPEGHEVGWLAVSHGGLVGAHPVEAGEMAIFERGTGTIELEGAPGEDTIFVLASAVPHPHDLVTGYYSVHTSTEALIEGEARIAELRSRLTSDPNAPGSVPVFKG